MKQQLVSLGCPAEKVFVQRLGIEADELSFQLRDPDLDGTVRILAAGTFTEKKGLVYALEAFAHVSQKHRHIYLTIFGDARPNRPEEQAVKRELFDIVKRYHLTERVSFTGYQPHPVLVKAYYEHHLLISPSVHAQDGDNEGGSPVTITEAMATGMPVLSTWHCDIPEVVLDGVTGFLVPERDVEALTERLDFLVTHPEIWGPLGRAGRAHVETKFNARNQGQSLGKRYDSLHY